MRGFNPVLGFAFVTYTNYMIKISIQKNSKSEWNNSRIPRIVIETVETQVEDQESGLGRKCENVEKGAQGGGEFP